MFEIELGGFDELHRQPEEAQEAAEALDGEGCSLQPFQPPEKILFTHRCPRLIGLPAEGRLCPQPGSVNGVRL